jgi:hypothetical protein
MASYNVKISSNRGLLLNTGDKSAAPYWLRENVFATVNAFYFFAVVIKIEKHFAERHISFNI